MMLLLLMEEKSVGTRPKKETLISPVDSKVGEGRGISDSYREEKKVFGFSGEREEPKGGAKVSDGNRRLEEKKKSIRFAAGDRWASRY